MSKLRIAMIGHKRVPSREGGIEVAVGELAQRMAAQGHTIELYNRLEDFSLKNISELPQTYKGAVLHHVPTLKSSAANAFLYSLLATLDAVGHHYDVIHYHAEGPAAMLLLPKLLGIPTVVTIHGLDWQRAKWKGFAVAYLRFGEKIAAKYADEIIVLSHGMQEYFLQKYHRETRCIPNGITAYPKTEAEQIIKCYGLKKDEYILYLGRLVPEKGVHYLIEAYKGIHTQKRLVIAGCIDGSRYVKYLRRLAASDRRILMVGFVTGRTLEELLSNAFLFVLPSDIEGCALSLLEALGHGTHCLVSDILENTEIGGQYVDVFEKGNISHLRKKLEEILDGDSCFLSAEQMQFVRRENGWNEVTEETIGVYHSAVTGRHEHAHQADVKGYACLEID